MSSGQKAAAEREEENYLSYLQTRYIEKSTKILENYGSKNNKELEVIGRNIMELEFMEAEARKIIAEVPMTARDRSLLEGYIAKASRLYREGILK